MNQAQNHHSAAPSPKAQTSWLERNIQEVERLLAADREAVFKNPESFSARLILQSTENRLLELRNAPQSFLCADCGDPAPFDRDDLAFGLCGHCENRLNSQGVKYRDQSER